MQSGNAVGWGHCEISAFVLNKTWMDVKHDVGQKAWKPPLWGSFKLASFVDVLLQISVFHLCFHFSIWFNWENSYLKKMPMFCSSGLSPPPWHEAGMGRGCSASAVRNWADGKPQWPYPDICHLDVCISKNCCNLWPGVAFAAWSGLWVGRCSTAFSPGPCRTASSASSAGPGQSWPLRSSLCVCVNLLDCLLWAFVGSCKGAV